MAKKMFTLTLKDGVEVRTLEELRKNFDLEKVVEYFNSGELLEWLENRFYDDEAEAIENIDANDRNLTTKICAALNVECDDDLEFMQRLREKKNILSKMTDDESIIENAAATALNQEDLATLINMDYKTIYLCGENFNVPIRMTGVKYVGILGTPKIKVRAKLQEDLDAQNISFENVQLPWQKAAPIEELKAHVEKIFQNGGKWHVMKNGGIISSFDRLGKDSKSAALRMICHDKYTEQQIIYMQLTADLSSGFAFTIDSFCTGGGVGVKMIPYKEIQTVTGSKRGLTIEQFDKKFFTFSDSGFNLLKDSNDCKNLFNNTDYEKIAKFLEVAKNF